MANNGPAILKGPPLAGAMTDVRGAKCINCYQYLGSVVKGTRRKISQAHDEAREVDPSIEHRPRRGLSLRSEPTIPHPPRQSIACIDLSNGDSWLTFNCVSPVGSASTPSWP